MRNFYTSLRVRQSLLAWCFAWLLAAGPALAQPQLVKDILGPAEGCCANASSAAPTNLTSLNGTLYYAAASGENGRELWRSNGTEAGTTLVKDIWPGANGSNPTGLTRVGTTLYFAADGPAGVELWKSTGTGAGTVLLKDILPGAGSSSPARLTDVNGTLYFTATDAAGPALWKSNGTAAGTTKVTAGTVENLTNANGTLYFTRTFADGWELWKSNGTAAGTVLLRKVTVDPTYQSNANFTPAHLTSVNGTLYFSAPDETGRELWKSNGTAAGTVRVKDIYPGMYYFSYHDEGEWHYIEYFNDSAPHHLVNLNGTLYFTATTEDENGYGTYLWKTDGTDAGTVPVKSLNVERQLVVNGTLYLFHVRNYDNFELWKSDGTTAGTTLVKSYIGKPGGLLNGNGTLYFTAYHEMLEPGTNYSTTAWRLWKSNGTGAGTVPVATLLPEADNPANFQLTNVNGTVFFANFTYDNGVELWKSNGTRAGTGLVKDTYLAPLSLDANPADLTNVNGTLFFTAWTYTGRDLWKSNGTRAGTVKVKDLYDYFSAATSGVGNLTNLNGTLLFTLLGQDSHYQLWRSDGTDAGTVLLRDFGRVSEAEGQPAVRVVNGTLYVAVHRSPGAHELWKSNGTGAGTVKVKTLTIDLAGSGAFPQHLTNVNGTLFFVARNGNDEWQLWKSNGTDAGTVPVRKVGVESNLEHDYWAWRTFPGPFVAANGILYFAGNDPATGSELWKSNGTAAGTLRVKDIYPGSGSANPASLVSLNGTVYFAATDNTGGTELWKSDGTAAGTVRVKDIHPGMPGASPAQLTVLNGALYFSANDGTGGVELWKSNGTATGTVRVKDIAAGATGATPAGLAAVGGQLYFRANDGTHGSELWRSDGTAAGTQLVQDIYGGRAASLPGAFTAAGGTVFFAATTASAGRELWQYNPATCVTPDVNLTVVPATVCPGNAATLQVKAAQAGVQYQLYFGGSALGSAFDGAGGDLYFTVAAASLTAGTNTFAVRAKGCVEVELAQKATVTVVTSLPAPVVAGVTISSGQAATLTASGGPAGAQYLWFNAASGGTLLRTGTSFTTPALTVTTDYYVAAQLPGCANSARTKATVTVAGAAAGTFRVNAGGNGFATIDARNFTADAYFSGGSVSAATAAGIGGTGDDYLYQTGRHGASFSYNFPTGNGSYDVVLHFAETYWGNTVPGGIGSRKFHVNLEGARKLTDYDVFAKAGGTLRATQETFRVTVNDGTLNVNFLKGLADNPAVKAIEVLPAGSGLTINAGGAAFTTGTGKRFSSDVYYADGRVSSVAGGEIANTGDDALYHNARVGVFSYGLPSGNGTFNVTLHFAETYFGSRATGGAGSRTFNVYLEGVKRLSEYDVFAKAGGALRAVRETVQVTVTDGVLNLYFAKGLADNPLVSAIEVTPAAAAAREAAPAASAEAGQVTLFPNPVQDKLTVTLPFAASQVEATAVTDAAGTVRLRNAHRPTGENALEIRTGGLPAGLYLLRLDTPPGRRVLRFVK